MGMPAVVERVARPDVCFATVELTLSQLCGSTYANAVARGRSALLGEGQGTQALVDTPVDFFPQSMERRLVELLSNVGRIIVEGAGATARGATTTKFAAATNVAAAPVTGLGCYRLGEDGRLYLTTKAEHYHASLGHSFPGYRLIDIARALGIPNATHNNTRGHITRLLEEELVRVANRIAPGDRAALDAVLTSSDPKALNRVLNLETGSLALEAAIKMCLARFYHIQPDAPQPKYRGRQPVMVVIGDEAGGTASNYHGTTVFAQCMRGMWSDLAGSLEGAGLFRTVPVPYNDIAALEAVFAKYDAGQFKIAGFFHELILMNYGGIRIEPAFIRRAYELCEQHDVPTIVDEIQSGIWAEQLLLCHEYGIKPTMIGLGKGFPGGEYPASRLIFAAGMDNLPQFGALVTNGQEELSSLAYLITMKWAEANAKVTAAIGDYYEQRVTELVERHGGLFAGWAGRRHLIGLRFRDLTTAKAFAKSLNNMGVDISVQAYKSDCPPAALTKLPLIAGTEVIDLLIAKMDEAARML